MKQIIVLAYLISLSVACLPTEYNKNYKISINLGDKTTTTSTTPRPPDTTKPTPPVLWTGFIEATPNIAVESGQDVTLTCVIKSEAIDYSVVWYYEGQTIAQSTRNPNDRTFETFTKNCTYNATVNGDLFSLHVRNASKAVSGYYSWKVKVLGTPVALRATRLHAVETRSVNPQNVQPHRGDTVEIKCGAKIPDTIFKAEWLHGKRIIKSVEATTKTRVEAILGSSGWQLRMVDVEFKDSGNYTCKIYGSTEISVQIIVLHVSRAPKNVKFVSVGFGKNITLFSKVHVTEKLEKVMWVFQERILAYHDFTNGEMKSSIDTSVLNIGYCLEWKTSYSILYIRNANEKHVGAYVLVSISKSNKVMERKYFELHVFFQNLTVLEPMEFFDNFGYINSLVS